MKIEEGKENNIPRILSTTRRAKTMRDSLFRVSSLKYPVRARARLRIRVRCVSLCARVYIHVYNINNNRRTAHLFNETAPIKTGISLAGIPREI